MYTDTDTGTKAPAMGEGDPRAHGVTPPRRGGHQPG